MQTLHLNINTAPTEFEIQEYITSTVKVRTEWLKGLRRAYPAKTTQETLIKCVRQNYPHAIDVIPRRDPVGRWILEITFGVSYEQQRDPVQTESTDPTSAE